MPVNQEISVRSVLVLAHASLRQRRIAQNRKPLRHKFASARHAKLGPLQHHRIAPVVEHHAILIDRLLQLIAGRGPIAKNLIRAVEQLPPGYKTVFVLHDIEGYTFAEISGLTDVGISTLHGRLLAARKSIDSYVAQVDADRGTSYQEASDDV